MHQAPHNCASAPHALVYHITSIAVLNQDRNERLAGGGSAAMEFSSTIRVADLNDYIAPSQDCVVALNGKLKTVEVSGGGLAEGLGGRRCAARISAACVPCVLLGWTCVNGRYGW